MAVWPASLQQSFPLETLEVAGDVRLRTEMDVGTAKLRRRSSGVIRRYQIPADRFIFTNAQKATLETFYETTLAGGTLPFDWTDPWPGAGLKTFRFLSTLSWLPIIPGNSERRLRIPLALEELP